MQHHPFEAPLSTHVLMQDLVPWRYLIHKSLYTTPAMAAGVSDKLWSIADIVALVPEPEAKKRGSCKKKNSN